MTFAHVIPHIYEKYALKDANKVKGYSMGGSISNSLLSGLKYGGMGALMGGKTWGIGLGLLGAGTEAMKKTESKKMEEAHQRALESTENSTPEGTGIDALSPGAKFASHGISENSLNPYNGQSPQNTATTPQQSAPTGSIDSYKTEEQNAPPPPPPPPQEPSTPMSHGGHAESSLGEAALNMAHNSHVKSAVGNIPSQMVNAYNQFKDIKKDAENNGVSPYAAMSNYASHMALTELLRKQKDKKEDKDLPSTIALAAIAIGGGAYAAYKNKKSKKLSDGTKILSGILQDKKEDANAFIKNIPQVQKITNVYDSLSDQQKIFINNLLQKKD